MTKLVGDEWPNVGFLGIYATEEFVEESEQGASTSAVLWFVTLPLFKP